MDKKYCFSKEPKSMCGAVVYTGSIAGFSKGHKSFAIDNGSYTELGRIKMCFCLVVLKIIGMKGRSVP